MLELVWLYYFVHLVGTTNTGHVRNNAIGSYTCLQLYNHLWVVKIEMFDLSDV